MASATTHVQHAAFVTNPGMSSLAISSNPCSISTTLSPSDTSEPAIRLGFGQCPALRSTSGYSASRPGNGQAVLHPTRTFKPKQEVQAGASARRWSYGIRDRLLRPRSQAMRKATASRRVGFSPPSHVTTARRCRPIQNPRSPNRSDTARASHTWENSKTASRRRVPQARASPG